MKPININKKDGSKTTSASNTIWDGPDIPCLDLCKGDTIDKVIYDLALKVCKKFEELDPDNYNLECLDLEGCDTITFQQLIQLLIDRSCEQEGDTPPPSNGGGTPQPSVFVPQTVKYAQDQLALTGANISADFDVPTPLSFTEYTVPTGQTGLYEIDFNCDVTLTNGRGLEFSLQINGTPHLPTIINRSIAFNPVPQSTGSSIFFTRLFASNVLLQPTDEIVITVRRFNFAGVFGEGHSINRGVFKLTKIS